jgi:hypothetical protein
MTRMFVWFREEFDAGSLGCYNPASLGGRSLHAEGRGIDIALNAHDPAQRARGDAIFDLVMAHPDWFGAQEMLWRGFLWSWINRHLGKRGPGIQQRDHENHVHLGVDVNAALHWQPSWVQNRPSADPVPEKKKRRNPHMIFYIIDGNKEAYQYVGGSTTEKASYIRLYGQELLVNHDKGSPLIRLSKSEFQAFISGAPLDGLGARGWTF